MYWPWRLSSHRRCCKRVSKVSQRRPLIGPAPCVGKRCRHMAAELSGQRLLRLRLTCSDQRLAHKPSVNCLDQLPRCCEFPLTTSCCAIFTAQRVEIALQIVVEV